MRLSLFEGACAPRAPAVKQEGSVRVAHSPSIHRLDHTACSTSRDLSQAVQQQQQQSRRRGPPETPAANIMAKAMSKDADAGVHIDGLDADLFRVPVDSGEQLVGLAANPKQLAQTAGKLLLYPASSFSSMSVAGSGSSATTAVQPGPKCSASLLPLSIPALQSTSPW